MASSRGPATLHSRSKQRPEKSGHKKTGKRRPASREYDKRVSPMPLCARELGTLSAVTHLSGGRFGADRLCVDLGQRFEDANDLIGGAGIVDGLRVAARLDELLRAELRKMLRERRLAEADLSR